MKFTNQEAYDFFLNSTSHLPRNLKKTDKCNAAAVKYIEENPSVAEIYNKSALIRKYERLLESLPSRKITPQAKVEWGSKIFIEFEDAACTTGRSLGGRPKLSLADNPSKRTTLNLLTDPVEAIEEFAKTQGIDNEAALQLIIDRCKTKWKVHNEQTSIPIEDATALAYNCNFSTRQYQNIKSVLQDFDFRMPTRNAVDVFKKDLHPKITCLELKSSVNYRSLVNQTISAIVDICKTKLDPKEYSLKCFGKVGIDGSGSHQIRHQLVDKNTAVIELPHVDPEHVGNYLLACYCPLSLVAQNKINNEEVVLWKNNQSNSTIYTRPISLLRAKENRSVIAAEFSTLFEDVSKNTNDVLNNCKPFDVVYSTEVSMIDGKMVSILQGDSGAHCHYCGSTKADSNDIINILRGFKITKTYESCKKKWEEMLSGDVKHDDKKREGQCHEPLTGVMFFSVLHWKLRAFDSCLNILYRLVAGTYVWGESDHKAMKFVKQAKSEVIAHVREKTGMLLDTPTSGGGNTNSGNLAEKFFSPVYRGVIIELIRNTSDKNNFELVLSYFNKILTITQSVCETKKVNSSKVRDLGINLMNLLRTGFCDTAGKSWIIISPSVHQLCAHSWELLEILDGGSLGKYSEQPQEAWNKYVRTFKSGPSARSRQCSVKLNIYDVLKRMLIMSHPLVASKKKTPTCSICHMDGHTSRSNIHKEQVLTQEESEILDLYI